MKLVIVSGMLLVASACAPSQASPPLTVANVDAGEEPALVEHVDMTEEAHELAPLHKTRRPKKDRSGLAVALVFTGLASLSLFVVGGYALSQSGGWYGR
jgi:hypothetical protein